MANGIYKDITDQDYIQYTASAYADIRQQILQKKDNIIKNLIDLIPSQPISNYAFANNGNLTFTNQAKEWGLDEPSFSNGSAYGDLDNDGDLDLVINNVNMPCFIYRNQSIEQKRGNNFIGISLLGEGKNTFGIGAKVTVYHSGTVAFQEEMPARGFESTVDSRLNFGIGSAARVDSIVVVWNSGKKTVLKDVYANQRLIIKEADAVQSLKVKSEKTIFTSLSVSQNNYGLNFTHYENNYSDFDRDLLMYQMLSTQGPRMAKGDVNGDGLEDVYICGAKDELGALLMQQQNGNFVSINKELLEKDRPSEDTDALFFDADGDGDMDLYVCSGGNEFSPNSTDLIDRLYLNDGKGKLTKSPQILPSFIFESSSSVSGADYDNDGDIDLFVGVRAKPGQYGYNCKGYILNNNGRGIFSDVTNTVCPALNEVGMVTDAEWTDFNKDGKIDLIIVGEYIPVRVFKNLGNSKLTENTQQLGLSKTNGWWNRLTIADINNDGYADLVCGNLGLNSRFKATAKKPLTLYVGDIDQNGSIEQLMTMYNQDTAYPVALRHDLVSVLPGLKKKYLKYEQYKNQRIEDILTPEQLGKCKKLMTFTMESAVFINQGGKGFLSRPLPTAAQLSPIYGISVADFDKDGIADILLGGNFYQCKPEVGIYNGSYGILLKGDGKGNFASLPPKKSGVEINGAVRDIIILKVGKNNIVLIAKNNETTQLLKF